MIVNDVYEFFIKKAGVRFENTCDGILYGHKENEVTNAATCFAATAEVIKSAMDKNVSLLICHEPMFAFSNNRDDALGIEGEKWKLLDKSGLTVLRIHDYAHSIQPDYIHDGFIRKLELKIKRGFPLESLGIRRYELEEETDVISIAELAKAKIGAEYPRIVGKKDLPVRYICLALGGIGIDQVRILEREDCDLLITGEIGEVIDCNYLRDMNTFGIQGALLMIGHCTSEYSGMEKMADDIKNDLGIPCTYIHCGEVY